MDTSFLGCTYIHSVLSSEINNKWRLFVFVLSLSTIGNKAVGCELEVMRPVFVLTNFLPL